MPVEYAPAFLQHLCCSIGYKNSWPKVMLLFLWQHGFGPCCDWARPCTWDSFPSIRTVFQPPGMAIHLPGIVFHTLGIASHSPRIVFYPPGIAFCDVLSTWNRLQYTWNRLLFISNCLPSLQNSLPFTRHRLPSTRNSHSSQLLDAIMHLV